MSSRAARITLAALLLVAGAGAALLTWTLASRAGRLDNDQHLVLAQLERLDAIAADIAAAQAAYVAPGQPNAPWFQRVAALTEDLAGGLVAVRPKVRSAQAARRLQDADAQISELLAADLTARDHLRLDEELLAADVIFGEAGQVLTTLRSTIAAMRRDEDAAFGAERGRLVQQMAIVPAAAAALWVIGLLLLIRVPAAETTLLRIAPEPGGEVAAPAATPVAPVAGIELAAVADLCTAISRVATAKALPDLLARAATLLDATGVIVWMGAGEELFPAMSYGYDARFLSRLGSIPRTAGNATAAAWRTGELRTVPGDMSSNGAIVAPMFGPDACIGVVAAEVRHGREADSVTQAATTLIAAQVATVVPVWPAASSTPRAAEA